MKFKIIIIIYIIAFIAGGLFGWYIRPSQYIARKSVKRIDTIVAIQYRPAIEIESRGKIKFRSAATANISLPPLEIDSNAGRPFLLVRRFDGIQICSDTMSVAKLLDYIVTLPFDSELQTIIDRDTFDLGYSFPENIHRLNARYKPDSVITIYRENLQYIEKPTPWFQTPYAEAGKLIIYAAFGYLIAK